MPILSRKTTHSMALVQSEKLLKKTKTPWQKLWTIVMPKLRWNKWFSMLFDFSPCTQKMTNTETWWEVNLGWMTPLAFFMHPSAEQCAPKTLLSSEIMIANPEAIFFSRKYLENNVERIAQFQRKLILELWMQIRLRAQFKRIWSAALIQTLKTLS